jgi:hypothetical protein
MVGTDQRTIDELMKTPPTCDMAKPVPRRAITKAGRTYQKTPPLRAGMKIAPCRAISD